MSLKSAIVIPARLASTRLPEKLLLRESGKSLIQHTFEAANSSSKASSVIVATDNQSIVDEVESFGGSAVMTDPDHTCGTNRIAEVAQSLTDVEIVVNVQGDEPEITGEAIDLAIELLENNPECMVSTLAAPIRDKRLIDDPNCVKVVFDTNGRALYFSRSPIPFARDWNDSMLAESPPNWFQHIGLYAYRRQFLLDISSFPSCRIHEIESLEQLRFLQAGYTIQVGQIDHAFPGIDTPEDYATFVKRMAN